MLRFVLGCACGWTALERPDPATVTSLMDGTRVTSASLDIGGLSYLMAPTTLARIRFAVANDTCTHGATASISLSDRLPSTTSCAEMRALVALAAAGWAASWPGQVRFEDVSDDCVAQYGSVTTSTCSALFGGPAMIVVAMEASSTAARTPVDDGDYMRKIALHPSAPHEGHHQRLLLPRGVLGVAYVHSRVSSTWQTVDGRAPTYANGNGHALLETRAVVVELSSAEFDWCTRTEDACAAWAPRTEGCIPLLTVLVHELGHALGLGHPAQGDHWAVSPPAPIGVVPLWPDIVPSHDFGGRVPAMRATVDVFTSPLPSADCLEGVALLYGLGAPNVSALPARAGCDGETMDWHETDDDDWYDDDDADDGGAVLSAWWLWFWLLAVLVVFPIGWWYSYPLVVSDYAAQQNEPA